MKMFHVQQRTLVSTHLFGEAKNNNIQ